MGGVELNAELIEAEYKRRGYRLGWRFMMSPERMLQTASIAVVGLNPGGRGVHGPSWSQERGNAYLIEDWAGHPPGYAPLQVQVQKMCALAGSDIQTTFAAQFVPFRSPRWADLPNKNEAVKFGRSLWSWALERSPAVTLLCLGKYGAAPHLAELISASMVARLSAGWGDQTIDVYRDGKGRRIIALPHLSTFRLFGRSASENAFLKALKA
jgi:hypothetical protein